MTTPTASTLDTKLTLAIGLAYRNGYELPDGATVGRAVRFLSGLGEHVPSVAGTAEVAIGPDGAIEFLLTTSRAIVSASFEPGEERAEVVIENRRSGEIAEEEWLTPDESLQRLATIIA